VIFGTFAVNLMCQRIFNYKCFIMDHIIRIWLQFCLCKLEAQKVKIRQQIRHAEIVLKISFQHSLKIFL